MAGLSASTWGDPNATKHVLMIHGITSSSQIWYRIAQGFASQGYFVTAPDLLSHGYARCGSNYTIAVLAEELRPFFATVGGDDHPYNIVIGHSLGGLVTSVLLPLLKSTRSVHIVLIDPPLEQTAKLLANYKGRFSEDVRNPMTPEAFLQEWPLWTREDAISTYMGHSLCNVAAIEVIFNQNSDWSFSHLLSTAPDNVKVTILVADPSKEPCTRMEELEPYPHVTTHTVWGASHVIPMEFPWVVIDAALKGTKSQN